VTQQFDMVVQQPLELLILRLERGSLLGSGPPVLPIHALRLALDTWSTSRFLAPTLEMRNRDLLLARAAPPALDVNGGMWWCVDEDLQIFSWPDKHCTLLVGVWAVLSILRAAPTAGLRSGRHQWSLDPAVVVDGVVASWKWRAYHPILLTPYVSILINSKRRWPALRWDVLIPHVVRPVVMTDRQACTTMYVRGRSGGHGWPVHVRKYM
jgi:hypothetical protein